MAYTIEEFKAAVSDWEMQAEDVRSLFIDVWNEELSTEDLPTLENIGKLEVADTWGGEGDGAEIYAVVRVVGEDGDRYFQASGYYSSWGDTDMDGDIIEVRPKEVQVTRYEAV